MLPFEFNPTETQKHLLVCTCTQGQQFLKVVRAFQCKELSFRYTVNAIKYRIISERKSWNDFSKTTNHRQGTDKAPNSQNCTCKQNVIRKYHITPYHQDWLVSTYFESLRSPEPLLLWRLLRISTEISQLRLWSEQTVHLTAKLSTHLIHYSLVSRCLWSSASLPPAMKWIEHNSWRIMRPTRNVAQWNCR